VVVKAAGRPLRLRRPDLIAKAAKSMHTLDLVSQKRVYSLRPACHSWRASTWQPWLSSRAAGASTDDHSWATGAIRLGMGSVS